MELQDTRHSPFVKVVNGPYEVGNKEILKRRDVQKGKEVVKRRM